MTEEFTGRGLYTSVCVFVCGCIGQWEEGRPTVKDVKKNLKV